MSLQIKSTNDIKIDRAKLIIYGPPGHGKTSLAASTGGPTLIISAEAGLLCLEKAKEIFGSQDMILDYVDLTVDDETGELLDAGQRLEKFKEIYQKLATDEETKSKYEFVVIDSASEIAYNIMKWLEPQYPTDVRGQYGQFAKEMMAIVTAIRDLPSYHVIFLAHSEKDKNEEGEYVTGLALPGKAIHAEIPKLMDGIYYYYLNQDKDGNDIRKLVTKGKETLVAKDRGGRLDRLEEPNIANIIKKLKGEK